MMPIQKVRTEIQRLQSVSSEAPGRVVQWRCRCRCNWQARAVPEEGGCENVRDDGTCTLYLPNKVE